jgi:anti-sigma factor RsiW
MMSCKELVTLVTEYFDGALPAEPRLRFEQHLAICPPCRGYLSQMRETIRVAGALTEETISPGARAALLEAFDGWQAAG